MATVTTLNRCRKYKPCKKGWKKLLSGLGKIRSDDDPLPYARIVEINGLDTALAACWVEPRLSKKWRLFAVFCARQVEYLLHDKRQKAALDVAELFANGQASNEELFEAWADTLSACSSVEDTASGYAAAAVKAATCRDAAEAAVVASLVARDAVEFAGGDEKAVFAAQKREFLRVVGS